MTIFYSKLSSPFGTIYIAFTEKGVSRIDFGHGSRNTFFKNLKKSCPRKAIKKVIKNDRGVTVLKKEMKAYLKGRSESGNGNRKPFSFSLPVDLLGGTPFERKVWNRIKKIPYGRVITYGYLASEIGRPGASRAVGMACKKNPLPILIPCHRVVGKDLSLTGYSSGMNHMVHTSGIEIKRRLLEIEGIRIKGDNRFKISGIF